jgi:hypothetical protein
MTILNKHTLAKVVLEHLEPSNRDPIILAIILFVAINQLAKRKKPMASE